MPQSRFSKAKVSTIVTAIPPVRKSIDDEIDSYGGDKAQIERIKKTIGLNVRYVASEGMTASDMCEAAAEVLLEKASVERNEVDALIMVTQTPDYFQPATAAYLHGQLGLSENCASFDVNLGCSGYVYGLWLAFMMVEAGNCKKVLLLAGDTMSRCVHPRDRAVAPLFGDAGTATLVVRSEKATDSYFSLHTDGTGFQHIMVPAGGFRTPRSPATSAETEDENGNVRTLDHLRMNGSEVFNFSIKVEPPAVREILEYSNSTPESVDYIVFHQANKYIISNIARRLKFPLDKAPSGTVEKFGNQSSASIPATVCDALADEISAGSKKVVFSGFGVGLSWASCLFDLENVQCSIEYM